MKVTLLGPAFPFKGGIAAFNERLAQECAIHGDDVDIITFTTQYPSVLYPGKSQFREGKGPEGIPIRRMISSVNPLSWQKTGNFIRKQQPELLITRFWIPFTGPALGRTCRLAKKNGKTKVIAIIDNAIPHENRPGDKALTHYFMKSVDAFITMSDQVAADLKIFDQKKPRIQHPHPIYDTYGDPVSKSAARTRLGLNPDRKYLLFFGYIRDYKGLDLLLKSLKAKPEIPLDVDVIVAGEFFNNETKYRQLIEELGIQDRVKLHTKFIPDDQVKYYFCAADLVVQPYHSATQSGVTQIAYHFNKPMLVTNVGGLPELVSHGKSGYVVERDPGEIAGAVKDFYEAEREERFVKNTEIEKQRFSWGRFYELMTELYQKL